MDDLVAFMAARLDEDEAEARPQADWLREYEKRPGDWARFMFDPVIGPFGGQSPLRDVARGLYVGRMADPDRVLRDVEADRRLLAEWQKAEADPAVDDQWNAGLAAGLRLAVQIRATRYSGHPGYRAEWKP
jgi:hypothetical protein